MNLFQYSLCKKINDGSLREQTSIRKYQLNEIIGTILWDLM